jgi:hypothetical protein
MTNEHPIAERERTITEGATSWARLDALLMQQAARARLHAEGASDWNSRDVYAHFARWTGNTVVQLRRKMAGIDWLPAIPGSDDEINERWAAEDRALTLDQARSWCLQTRTTLVDLMLALTPEEWTRFGGRCTPDIAGEHYQSHIDFIERGGA